MTVTSLQLRENARHDTWRLVGTTTGDPERIVRLTPGIDRLTEGLSTASLKWHEGETDLLRRTARDIAFEASALGLNRISRVARTVEILVDAGDPPALGANVARLMRLGQSMVEDLRDLRERPG